MSQTGLFPVTYVVATPAIGAPVLTLSLLVNTPAKKVSGIAKITQSTNPPLVFHADVWGTFSQLRVEEGAEASIILTLDGNPSGQTSMIAETFHFHGILSSNWQTGQASYRYEEGGRWHAVEHAVMTVEQRVQLPYQPIMPMYAVSLQQAKASGDLGQMKTLASLAEKQLADAPQIKAELDKLHTEIAKLEGRA
ncbi:DUF1842 domain-containing protein [Ralstonia pseudosolanacearum]|uniref:DUF1842 domain-containing protein n=1 Tax=Ralstonia solanacearum TaxID=305 RepID=A0AA92JRV6_RALSL|nr:DUF1842 domain-containing protein [Ralstonia pseudosolanacearum]CBJ37940.1 conserved protein of unknown function, DUF1842 [Ralstonia solanacearum CMR15]QOK91704.1 DUF1842 domain-containing protein [Ralstonia pseudosolanacearum]QOK96618.1 DUF1842 domain-containing protein [Ralstonia pseudosolanacearum]UWD89597.1 DUF1842 domain-containing protein [Ralstonia pseudosolanacearum]CAH0440261.1 hypothetical protein LMG9673_01049 [Ralstonia pseudosolanacearum]